MSNCSAFPSWPKIPRLNNGRIMVTEKLDGTNGLVSVRLRDPGEAELAPGEVPATVDGPDGTPVTYVVRAGSRNRWLTVDRDNFGFARWVADNATDLVQLGPGLHYGEWFGRGIQRGYGLSERRFALFDAARWYDPGDPPRREYRGMLDLAPCPTVCTVVPILYYGPAGTLPAVVDILRTTMELEGSVMVPGFNRPEGLIIYHEAARQYFKVLFEGDTPKSLQHAA